MIPTRGILFWLTTPPLCARSYPRQQTCHILTDPMASPATGSPVYHHHHPEVRRAVSRTGPTVTNHHLIRSGTLQSGYTACRRDGTATELSFSTLLLGCLTNCTCTYKAELRSGLWRRFSCEVEAIQAKATDSSCLNRTSSGRAVNSSLAPRNRYSVRIPQH